jgi:hypothetical protein
MILRTLTLALVLAACQSTPSTPTTTTTTPVTTEPPPGPSPATPAAGPGIGENCGPGDVCGSGLECITYLGVAGARGPEFKTCELRCSDTQPCPAGKQCNTIADGPGQVCR